MLGESARLCAGIIPQNLSGIESWRLYFFENRTSIFVTGALWFTAIALINQLIQGSSPFRWLQITLYVTIGVFIVGIATANEQVHAVITIWPPMFLVLFIVRMSQPDQLFR
jgi:peptidoglycan/LPS O-acetylase OafA/YrhL